MKIICAVNTTLRTDDPFKPFCDQDHQNQDLTSTAAVLSLDQKLEWAYHHSSFDFGCGQMIRSILRAKHREPTLFLKAGLKGALPRSYFASLPVWCAVIRRSMSVAMPVYTLPSRHLTIYLDHLGFFSGLAPRIANHFPLQSISG